MTKTTQKKKSFISRIKEFADVITAVSIIGAALVAIGTWCTSKINETTNQKLDAISSKLDTVEASSTRTQLLTLLSSYPDNEEEILKVARYYFRDLNGDWYMTSLFTRWAATHNIDISDIIKVKGD